MVVRKEITQWWRGLGDVPRVAQKTSGFWIYIKDLRGFIYAAVLTMWISLRLRSMSVVNVLSCLLCFLFGACAPSRFLAFWKKKSPVHCCITKMSLVWSKRMIEDGGDKWQDGRWCLGGPWEVAWRHPTDMASCIPAKSEIHREQRVRAAPSPRWSLV